MCAVFFKREPAAFEEGSGSAFVGAATKNLDEAVKLQAKFGKASFESYVAHAGNLGELYTNIAKTADKSVEAAITKACAEQIRPLKN